MSHTRNQTVTASFYYWIEGPVLLWVKYINWLGGFCKGRAWLSHQQCFNERRPISGRPGKIELLHQIELTLACWKPLVWSNLSCSKVAQKSKSCSKLLVLKKLLETPKVARNTKSCSKVAEQHYLDMPQPISSFFRVYTSHNQAKWFQRIMMIVG